MRFPRWAAWLIFILIVGGVWFYFTFTPSVMVFLPILNQGSLSPNTNIQIVFSDFMQPDSVMEHLQISPEVPGEWVWTGRTLSFEPADFWPQGTEVRVELEAGARSRLGLPSQEGYVWIFNIGKTVMTYLWPAGDEADIYILDIESGETQQLTHIGGVQEYVVNQDNGAIYFSALNSSGGSDLYQTQRWQAEAEILLECGRVFCSVPQISSGGDRLAYERSDPEQERRGDFASEIWLLDLNSGETERISSYQHQARHPVWSEQGLLAYYDVDRAAYVFYDPATGRRQTWPNQIGEPGIWSLDGQSFVARQGRVVETSSLENSINAEIEEVISGPSGETRFLVVVSHLVEYNLASGEERDLSLVSFVDDANPSFSPSGGRIAFTRRYLDPYRWQLGRQIWTMNADGTQLTQLTDAGGFHYSAIAWHPAGGQIAVLRFDNTSFVEPPEIWLIDLTTQENYRVVIGGFSPQWIP